MLLIRFSVSTLLSEKSASIFYVTKETSIKQAVSGMNRQCIGSIIAKKKGCSICGIFNELDVLTSVVTAVRVPKASQVRQVVTMCIQRNLLYFISA